MKETFMKYLEEPTLENFLALRAATMSAEGFNPYADELDGVDDLLEQEDYAGAVERINNAMFPNHFLSPPTHFTLSFAYHKMGNEEAADAEGMLAVILTKGIEMTGDGSKEKPILVSRLSDEYDYLRANSLTLESQTLMHANEREYDVLNTKERGAVWFDITEIREHLARQLGMK